MWCDKEGWHRDSGAAGITVIVPLGERGIDEKGSGSFEVLTGTNSGGGNTSLGRRQVLKNLKPGDAVVLDARTLRRGAFNDNMHRSAPFLMVRYDVAGNVAAVDSQNYVRLLHASWGGWLVGLAQEWYAWM